MPLLKIESFVERSAAMSDVFHWKVCLGSSRIFLDKCLGLQSLPSGSLRVAARHQLIHAPSTKRSQSVGNDFEELKFKDERILGREVKFGIRLEPPEADSVKANWDADYYIVIKDPTNGHVYMNKSGRFQAGEDGMHVIVGGNFPSSVLYEELDAMFSFVVEDFKVGSLFYDLGRCFNTDHLSDVEVALPDGRRLKCHKFVLSLRSPVFERMLSNREFEDIRDGVITVEDINADAIEALLKYLYTDHVQESQINLSLFFAADKYQIANLTKLCENHLLKTLTRENVIDILVAAYLVENSTSSMLKTVMGFLNTHKDVLTATEWDKLKSTYPAIGNRMLEIILDIE